MSFLSAFANSESKIVRILRLSNIFQEYRHIFFNIFYKVNLVLRGPIVESMLFWACKLSKYLSQIIISYLHTYTSFAFHSCLAANISTSFRKSDIAPLFTSLNSTYNNKILFAEKITKSNSKNVCDMLN